jgi:sarcosine oxidase subunit alpha
MADKETPLRTNGDLKRGEPVTIFMNDRPVRAFRGETVAAALWAEGVRTLRKSAKKGRASGMYCGMGVCFGCRVTIDGVPNVLACRTAVEEGMRVRRQEGHGQWENPSGLQTENQTQK